MALESGDGSNGERFDFHMSAQREIEGRRFVLGGYACLEITGEDADDFLQGQLSNDLNGLRPGAGQLSAFNDPQGRGIALIKLFRTADGLVAALPEVLAGAVAGRLGLFVLRSRVKIVSGTRWRLVGGAGRTPEADPEAPAMALPAAEALWLGLAENPPGDDAESAEWAAIETRNGVPEIYPETSGRFVAQMLRLDRMGAVSFTKGCYVGQEVIARAHHLGRVKRHTRLYRAPEGALRPGDPVMRGSDKVGDVVRVADDAGGRLALVVVRDDVAEPVSAGQTGLQRLPDPATFG